jgi:hypothetical protein
MECPLMNLVDKEDVLQPSNGAEADYDGPLLSYAFAENL